MTVAVTGLGAVSAFGFGIDALSQGLRRGRTGIRPLAAGEWPELAAPRWAAPAPALGEAELRDRIGAHHPAWAARVGRVSRGLRRSLALALLAAAEALAMAGRADAGADETLGLVVAGSNLFAGYGAAMASRIAEGASRPDARYGFALFDSHAVGVLSEVFGCRGAGLTVGAASASGLAAIVAAVDMLAAGRAAACLVVGLPVDFGRAEWAGLDLIGALAAERGIGAGPASRPFDAAASGFVPGETAAALLLERDRPDRATGIVAAAELCLDGSHLPSPSLPGEIRVMRRACAAAGRRPAEIDLVNAHATSTPLGDRVEAEAIATVFADAPGLRVNASKGLIGHGVHAAGLIETVGTLLQMRDGFIHANIGLSDPVYPLPYAGAEAVAQPVRRAMKTAFGFGGFGAALILEAP